MSNRLLRNFFQKPPQLLNFWRKGIPINPKLLEALEPGLIDNFKFMTANFIDGLLHRDESFLKQTVSPYLFSKIQAEISAIDHAAMQPLATALKLQHTEEADAALNMKDIRMRVYPYIVFRATLDARINSHPLSQVVQVTRNRFLNLKTGVSASFFDIVYGFKLEFDTSAELDRIFTVTYEGDLKA